MTGERLGIGVGCACVLVEGSIAAVTSCLGCVCSILWICGAPCGWEPPPD